MQFLVARTLSGRGISAIVNGSERDYRSDGKKSAIDMADFFHFSAA